MIKDPLSTPEERKPALESMILSVSGWRAVFGSSDDSLQTRISEPMYELVTVAGNVFAEYFLSIGAKEICVGKDSRPTGAAICSAVIPVLLSNGLSVRYLGIVPSPEIMAYVKTDPEIHGFIYVSASHNPPGHNGFKTGAGDGAVLNAADSARLIASFRESALDQSLLQRIKERAAALNRSEIQSVFSEESENRMMSKSSYSNFVLATAAAETGSEETRAFAEELRTRLLAHPLGIVAEMNGSARSVGVDSTLLPRIGARLVVKNAVPGRFSHEILPEGPALQEAATFLQNAAALDPSFQLAVVPDNDGDRGNLVFLEKSGTARTLDAQEVFALAVVTELSWLDRAASSRPGKPAVVVNGPTSLRIDRIAGVFGAEVHRAEVGEANVVALAQTLRNRGYTVRILGEGSNGGTIIEPSTVRDPLGTILGLCKLHGFDLFRVWCERSGRPDHYHENARLTEIAATLPVFTTTPTGEKRAKMQIRSVSHADLKKRYETLLSVKITEAIALLEPSFGPLTWRESNLEGTSEKVGVGPEFRSGAETGGLRVVFSAADRDVAAVWMRGSGTERVFRILADVEGPDRDLEERLLDWHRALVAEADTDPASG